MGVGVRVFFLEDDGCFKKISYKKFDRFYRRDPEITFPQKAGGEIRYVMVYLKLVDRVPVGLYRMEFNIIHVDEKGRRDQARAQELFTLCGESMNGFFQSRNKNKVVDIGPYLARKRIDKEYRWVPTEKQAMDVLAKSLGYRPKESP